MNTPLEISLLRKAVAAYLLLLTACAHNIAITYDGQTPVLLHPGQSAQFGSMTVTNNAK